MFNVVCFLIIWKIGRALTVLKGSSFLHSIPGDSPQLNNPLFKGTKHGSSLSLSGRFSPMPAHKIIQTSQYCSCSRSPNSELSPLFNDHLGTWVLCSELRTGWDQPYELITVQFIKQASFSLTEKQPEKLSKKKTTTKVQQEMQMMTTLGHILFCFSPILSQFCPRPWLTPLVFPDSYHTQSSL